MDIYEDEYEEKEDIGTALESEFSSAPWYVSSVSLHMLIFLIFLIFWIPQTREVVQRTVVIRPDIIVEEEPEDEIKEETIDEKEYQVENPEPTNVDAPIVVTTDVELEEHFETENDMEDDSAKGEPDLIADFDSEDKGTPALMGVGHSGGSGGGGCFGKRTGGGKRRALAIGGGGPKTQNALNSGLRWLAEHQEEDGHWDCQKYGGANHDVSVTALALLAFLGNGNSCKFGDYKDNVARATYWLLQQQKPNGCVGPHRYETAIAAMALAEAYGMGDRSIRPQAQKAIDWIVQSQCSTGGWDYKPNSGRTDVSVSGWHVMALKSGNVAGLTIPSEVFIKAEELIRAATKNTPDGYGAETLYAGNATTANQFSTSGKMHGKSDRRVAISSTCLQFLGVGRNDIQVQASANAILKDGVPSNNTVDFYRWYYATLGLFQMGIKSDYWKTWNLPMKETVCGLQVKVGTYKENKGSWNPDGDPYGNRWGRVGETAIGSLLLEIYFRYDQVSKH
jgi:hypothetical protein